MVERHGVPKLVAGTTIANVVALAAVPFLGRLYSPEAFGGLALFGAVTALLATIACLRYELAVVLPADDDEAVNLLAICVATSVVLGVCLLPLVLLVGDDVLERLGMSQLTPYRVLVPVVVTISGTLAGLTQWSMRRHRFGLMSISTVITVVSTVVIQIASGLLGMRTAMALVGAVVAGRMVSFLWVFGRTLSLDGVAMFRPVSARRVRDGLVRYRKFPLVGSWSVLLNSVSWQAPTFFLAWFFTPAVVGFFGVSNRILRQPMDVIGRSIGQVFFRDAAAARRDGTLQQLVESMLARLIRAGLMPLFCLMIVGRDLVVLVMGEQWAEAGLYVQMLSPWAFVWFTSAPITVLFSVLERQEAGLAMNAGILISRVAALSVGVWFGDARMTVGIYAASGVVTYLLVNLAVGTAAGLTRWRTLQLFGHGILEIAPLGLVLVVVSLISPLPILTVACGAMAVFVQGLRVLSDWGFGGAWGSLFRRRV